MRLIRDSTAQSPSSLLPPAVVLMKMEILGWQDPLGELQTGGSGGGESAQRVGLEAPAGWTYDRGIAFIGPSPNYITPQYILRPS